MCTIIQLCFSSYCIQVKEVNKVNTTSKVNTVHKPSKANTSIIQENTCIYTFKTLISIKIDKSNFCKNMLWEDIIFAKKCFQKYICQKSVCEKVFAKISLDTMQYILYCICIMKYHVHHAVLLCYPHKTIRIFLFG